MLAPFLASLGLVVLKKEEDDEEEEEYRAELDEDLVGSPLPLVTGWYLEDREKLSLIPMALRTVVIAYL